MKDLLQVAYDPDTGDGLNVDERRGTAGKNVFFLFFLAHAKYNHMLQMPTTNAISQAITWQNREAPRNT